MTVASPGKDSTGRNVAVTVANDGLGEANRKNLETVIGYCYQQGLTSKARSIDELFIDTDPEDGGDVDHV